MHVAIVHHFVDAASSMADRDVFDQIQHIEQALIESGIRTSRHMLDDSTAVFDRLARNDRPDAVFNLVECFRGKDRWMHIPPEHLDSLGISYTGSPSQVLELVNDKHAAKLRMLQSGIPTASWLSLNVEPINSRFFFEVEPGHVTALSKLKKCEFIIKSRFEHASVNLESDAIQRYDSGAQLMEAMQERGTILGPCLAEEFIDGREFNLSILEMSDGNPQVMAPAEIDFGNYPLDQYKMVGYRAKWIEDSIEYNTTPRRFLGPHEDEGLSRQLKDIALHCWREFDLRGYARVDFRVDRQGQPWVLEINANPCIAPWSGFTAACEQSGIDAKSFILNILGSALRNQKDLPRNSISAALA